MEMRTDGELQSLIPPLTPDERSALEASLIAEGCRDPLVVWDGVIVDGHNRYAICTARGIPFKTQPIIFADRLEAMIWIRRNQVSRRNLSDDQRVMNREALRRLESEKARADRARAARAAGGKATPEQMQDRLSVNASDKRSHDQRAMKAEASRPKRDTRAEAAAEIGQPGSEMRNRDGSSNFRVFKYDDLPPGFVVASVGIREQEAA